MRRASFYPGVNSFRVNFFYFRRFFLSPFQIFKDSKIFDFKFLYCYTPWHRCRGVLGLVKFSKGRELTTGAASPSRQREADVINNNSAVDSCV